MPVLTIKQESTSSSISLDSSLQSKVSSFVTNLRNRFNKLVGERRPTGAERYLDIDRQTNLMDEFKFYVPKDPYLSPYLASDENLKRFPPVRILVTIILWINLFTMIYYDFLFTDCPFGSVSR